MTRKEYMQNSSPRNHQKYYLNLAKSVGLTLPESLKERVLESKDSYFNDIPLELWDQLARSSKQQIAKANKIVNGESVWSLCDGVCMYKALAREYVRQQTGK